MPKCYENNQVANWALRQLRKKMPPRDPDETLHASEIFQCHRKTYHARTDPEEFPTDAILRFATGFALQEYFLGPEKDGEELRGIILSADRLVKGQIIEFKTTRMGYEVYAKDAKGKIDKTVPKIRFNPAENQYGTGWIERCAAYCVAHEVKKAHIMVFFLYSTEFSAWTLEFTNAELKAAGESIDKNRDLMQGYLDRKELPPLVSPDDSWQCKLCPYLDRCIDEVKAVGYLKEE